MLFEHWVNFTTDDKEMFWILQNNSQERKKTVSEVNMLFFLNLIFVFLIFFYSLA